MAIVTLLLVSFIVFSLMEMVPGNCAERYLAYKNTQGQQITVEDIEAEETAPRPGPALPRALGDLGRHGVLPGRLRRELHPARSHQRAARPEDLAFARHLLHRAALRLPDRDSGGNHLRHREQRHRQQHPAFPLLPRTGDAELPARADDHALLDHGLRREPDRALFQGVPGRALVLGQAHGLPRPGVAADRHSRLVGNRLRAADGAGADVGRARQAVRHRGAGAGDLRAVGCCGATRPAMRSARSSTRSAST